MKNGTWLIRSIQRIEVPLPPAGGPAHEWKEKCIYVLLESSHRIRKEAARKFRAAGQEMPRTWVNEQLQELIDHGNRLVRMSGGGLLNVD